MGFTFTIDTEKRVDPTGTLDYIVFFWCLLVTFAQTTSLIFYIWKRREYTPLRTKNYYYVYAAYIFGLVIIWATFIANDHMDKLNVIENHLCLFWSWILQYSIGFSMWYLFLIQYIISIAFRDFKWTKRVPIRVAIILFCILPINILVIIIWATDGTKFNADQNTCVSDIVWKIYLIVWLVCCMLFMFAVAIYLYLHFKPETFAEYNALKHILIIVFTIFLLDAIINIFGVVHYRFGRFVFTSSVAFLHGFIHFRFVSYRLYKAIINDKEYKIEILTSDEIVNIDIKTIKDLEKNDDLMDKFIKHLRDNKEVSTKDIEEWELISYIDIVDEKRKKRRSLKMESINLEDDDDDEVDENIEMQDIKSHTIVDIDLIPKNYAILYERLVDLDNLFEQLKDKKADHPRLNLNIKMKTADIVVQHLYEKSVLYVYIENNAVAIDYIENKENPQHKQLINLKKEIVKMMDIVWGKDYLKFDKTQYDIKYTKNSSYIFDSGNDHLLKDH